MDTDMFEFDKMCKKYEALSFEELKQIVMNESRIIMPALEALDGDGIGAFILFIATACAASGQLELAEYKLFEEVSGISVPYEDACEIVESAKGKDAQEVVDSIVDLFGVLDEDIKYSMTIFCLAFCAANGSINLKERKFIRKLLKQSV